MWRHADADALVRDRAVGSIRSKIDELEPMTMNEQFEIEELIKRAGDDSFFVGGATKEKIDEIEKDLDSKLPESFKWFLSKYGHGGCYGVLVNGVGKNGLQVCVRETLRRREYGLPEKYIVIENCDEWQYCLDTSNITNGECPVIVWEKGISKTAFNDFYQYLIERLKYAREDVE